eukprot:156801-Ditylum_brightwellii.AAC.1
MSSRSHSESAGENSARSAMIVVHDRCTFAQKALVVQALGASAIVIHCNDISQLSLLNQSYNLNNSILSGNTDYNLFVNKIQTLPPVFPPITAFLLARTKMLAVPGTFTCG